MRQKRRTAFALKAIGLAKLYEEMLGQLWLEGTIPYRSEMTSPDGPSTGGGVQATQHLSLIPENGTAALVFGHVNQFTRVAQLRSFDQVEAEYQARFKTPVPFTRERYEDYLTYVRDFLESKHLSVTLEPFSRASLNAKTPEEPRSSMGVLAVLMVAALAVLGAFVALNYL